MKIISTITGGRSRIYPASARNVTNNALYGMQRIAQNVLGIQVPDLGHGIPEQRPDFVIRMLDNFFLGNIMLQLEIF
jgi:hypothetical protein